MNIFVRLLDKIINRIITAFLLRAQIQHLHPHQILLERAQEEAANYVSQHMKTAVILETRNQVLEFAIARIPLAGDVLEFGVSGGDSIRFIAAKIQRPIHGFDSFEGLPEDWGGRHECKGHYSTGGLLPSVPNNVILYKGSFDETLPTYIESYEDPIALLHIDCDLYSSTKTILDELKARIFPGTIIVFDEYFNFVSWREHEFKAFKEFVTAYNVEYSYLCWGYQQVVIQINKIKFR